MVFTSTLADAISKIKLGYIRRESWVFVRRSNFLINVLTLLVNNSVLEGFQVLDDNTIRVYLKYYKGRPFAKELKLVSKPGWKKYGNYDKILKDAKKNLLSGFYVICTTEGLFTSTDLLFFENKISGKILLKVSF